MSLSGEFIRAKYGILSERYRIVPFFLIAAASIKINCFYVKVQTRKEAGEEYYYYEKIYMLERLGFDKFVDAIEEGIVLIDFDARTGHNHGTKFRMRQDTLPNLYDNVTIIEE